MSQMFPSAADNVRMERRSAISLAMRMLTAEHPQFTREQVRAHVANILLDSVNKQARWSAGLS